MAKDKNKKKSYGLGELGSLKRVGKEYLGVCPECGKRHLFVNLDKAVYKCFYAGCECQGHLAEANLKDWKESMRTFRKQQKKAEAGDALSSGTASGGMVKQKDGGWMAPPLPCDYKEVSVEVMDKITIITKDMESIHPAERRAEVSQVIYYLQSRHISIETAQALKIGAAMHHVNTKADNTDGQQMQFAYHGEVACISFLSTVNDRICTVKYRRIGQKGFAQDTADNSPQPPFNIDCINPLFLDEGEVPDNLICTEGEQDVMTLVECGFKYVISIGSANLEPREVLMAFREWLEPIRNIIICSDTDRPGRTQRMKLQHYFGVRSRIAHLPSDCKDISEVMEKYDRETVCQIINDAETPANTDIHHVSDYTDDTMRWIEGRGDEGYSIGYGPLTDGIFRLYDDGGVILATGKPGSGKTDILNDMMARLMLKRGKYVAFLSFEVPNKAKHISKMISIMLGRKDLSMFSKEDMIPYFNFLNEHMVHLTTDSCKATPHNIIDMVEHVRQNQPVDFLVIDPYLFIDTESGRNTTETQAIKKMLTEFQQWGRKNGIWIIIVAHPRMLQKVNGSNDLEDIDYYTLSGSANWANLGDYIFVVSRKEPDNPLFKDVPASTPPRSVTSLKMLKVRDQDYCQPGTVYYLRQPCGRYDEFETENQVEKAIISADPAASNIDSKPWMIDDAPL